MTTLPLDRAEVSELSPGIGDRVSDRLLGWRDAMYASAAFQRWAARFPLTRPIARARSRALFDLCAGFVYSQVLRACAELDLFGLVAARPLTLDALATTTGLAKPALERLIGAAIALRLLERRSGGRIGLGAVGAPLAHNEALGALIAHHALLYEDLRDPLELLRTASVRQTSLSHYYPYASGHPDAPTPSIEPQRAESYSRLMSATQGPLISEVLDGYSFARHTNVMDVGGGEGRFARALSARWPQLDVTVFDLPAVARRATAAIEAAGSGRRVRAVGGDFHAEPLPRGKDAITLVRVLLDHGDAAVVALLKRIHEALAPTGKLLIVEPMAGLRGAKAVGDAYFAMYLFAMGAGRARTPEELGSLCRCAGFTKTRTIPTQYPVSTGILVADR